ncbi:alpha/beta fold hydrolase [Flavobacterium proteolyticum]|uniref:Alpha/beta hydrolase n=1 Tax=Flavobacterium proteolyticum TaxID=2911683 RepID=A0ABR9WUB1_9FLAO|nr:alpha/beta hydrolase [Flavobacterium proteolyticum]MBE9577217.1 alpha/beta hydrolase [Flavobacterium proteolyticum]
MKKNYFIQTLIAIFITSFALGQNTLSTGDHFADVNGIKIHYYVSGKGPVCLVPTPGWGPSINYLKNSLKPFENFFKVVYYDTRISGQSTGPNDPTKYSSLDFMNDMDSLRVYLKQPKVWVMGHSMGGFQVLNYAIHHNENLNGIIALAPLAGRDSIYEKEFTKMVMKRKGEPYFEAGSNIFFRKDTTKNKNSEMMPYIFPFYFHDVSKISEFEKLGDPQMSDKAGEYTDASFFGTEYLFPQLYKIKVPTLIVVGDDDFVCDKVSQADRIHERITNSEIIVIKDAGHFSWVEQPKQFFMDIEKWLKKQNLMP